MRRASTDDQSTPWTVAFVEPGRPRAVVVLLLALAVIGGLARPWTPDGTGSDEIDGSAQPPSEEVEEEARQADDLPADTILAWSGEYLAEGYAQAVADDARTGPTTVVRGAIEELVRTEDAAGNVVDDPPDGWWYPVEVLAFDPATYDDVVGRPLVSELAPDEALLGETSARVRGLGPGALLEFADGSALRVVGVVPDELVGAAEVATRLDGPLDVQMEKYLLARPGDPETMHDALAEHGAVHRQPRLVAHGTTPVLRHAHSVLPAVGRKAHFGEFTMQDLPGRDIRPGHTWAKEHIATESVLILGRVTCHRKVLEPLRAAMQELADRGAAHLVSSYAGCWAPRTSGTTGPLSSHAWGMAVDVNAPTNPYGAEPRQPALLVDVMAEHGFLWGGDWDTPDGMHFELAPGRDTHRDE